MCELMWSSWNGRFDLLSLSNLVLVNIELDILTKNRSGGDQVNLPLLGLTSCVQSRCFLVFPVLQNSGNCEGSSV